MTEPIDFKDIKVGDVVMYKEKSASGNLEIEAKGTVTYRTELSLAFGSGDTAIRCRSGDTATRWRDDTMGRQWFLVERPRPWTEPGVGAIVVPRDLDYMWPIYFRITESTWLMASSSSRRVVDVDVAEVEQCMRKYGMIVIRDGREANKK